MFKRGGGFLSKIFKGEGHTIEETETKEREWYERKTPVRDRKNKKGMMPGDSRTDEPLSIGLIVGVPIQIDNNNKNKNREKRVIGKTLLGVDF